MSDRKKPHDRDGIFQREKNGPYWISYTGADGKRHQENTQTYSVTAARELREGKKAKAKKDRDLGYSAPSRDSFASFAPTYLKHQKANLTPKAYERTEGIVDNHLTSAFGSTRLSEIRSDHATDYIDSRLAKVKPGSVVREVNVLKHLLQFAVEKKKIPVNHVRGMKLPKANDERIRHLQPEQIHKLLAECPAWLRPIIGLLVATGMRRSEVLTLRWSWINRKQNTITLPKTKSGKFRVVQLNGNACMVLDSIAASGDLVFPEDDQVNPPNVSVAFQRAVHRAGIEDFRLHDLRHTFASRLVNDGVRIELVSKLLGHSDLRMTQRYSHLEPKQLQDAARRLDGIFTLEGFSHDVVTIEPQNLPKPTQSRPKRVPA